MTIRNKLFATTAALVCWLGMPTVQAQVVWPRITQQAKPWARWWWQGSAVNKADLTWNLESYQAAGLGGLEITPIYGVKGHEDEFIDFLSPRWMEMLQHTLAEAKKLNLGIDLANATGWPFGGPWVTRKDESKTLFWKEFTLKEGERLADSVVFIQPALIRADGVMPKISELKQPYASNPNLQKIALDQLRYQERVPLLVLMAYDGKGQAINLTAKVSANGKLDWTAPNGDWKLYGIFQGYHGKMVERAAPGGEGFVIDHFSKTALSNYLTRFDQAFAGKNISDIRAFFNDSYEVDDARGQANITPQIFDEFQKRRGYDLRSYLPALFGKLDKETNSRVLSDYRETMADLLLDNFTKPWTDWGHKRKALIRNQSHGSPANILDLYAAVDIPETEGGDVLQFKFATSAAHVSGKPLASAEAATWLNDHFLSSLSDVKGVMDNYFLGGVNHAVYHGVAYSPKNAPWPGWLFYAAVHFQQTNPFWTDFAALNNYVARVQSFLQQGKPDNDVLIYYPLYDSFAEPGRDILKHYDGLKPDFANAGLAKVAREMLKKGYTFDFITDRQILNLKQSGSKLLTGGVGYKTILLPDCKYISTTTFNKLVSLAKGGATIIVYKNLPKDVPGLGDLTARQAMFNNLINSFKLNSQNAVDKQCIVGSGKIVSADAVDDLMLSAGISRERITDNGLQFVRRRYHDGYCYFVKNSSAELFNGWVPLSVKANSVTMYDLMFRTAGLASIRNQRDGRSSIYLQLQPGESIMLTTSSQVLSEKKFSYYQPASKAFELKGEWTTRFIRGGPTLPSSIKTAEPKLWTDVGGNDAKAFSGTASYTTNFKKPVGTSSVYQLNLEKVYGSAAIYLNGNKLVTLIGPKYSFNIPARLFTTQNTLEIRVSNLMANRIRDMDLKGQPYRIFYNTNFPARDKVNAGADGKFTAAQWEVKPSGMEGAVTLKPMKVLEVK